MVGTPWNGLWENGKFFVSKPLKKKEIEKIKNNPVLLVTKNNSWRKDSDRPKYVFAFAEKREPYEGYENENKYDQVVEIHRLLVNLYSFVDPDCVPDIGLVDDAGYGYDVHGMLSFIEDAISDILEMPIFDNVEVYKRYN